MQRLALLLLVLLLPLGAALHQTAAGWGVQRLTVQILHSNCMSNSEPPLYVNNAIICGRLAANLGAGAHLTCMGGPWCSAL